MRSFLFGRLTLCASLALNACGSETPTEKGEPAVGGPTTERQLNLTVLLDLSNRINATYGQDTQQRRDTAIVGATARLFRDDIRRRGGFRAKGAYQVYFEPFPQQAPNLNQVARSLQYDLGLPGTKPADRKAAYVTVVPQTTRSVQTLYEYVRKQPFIGADIWSFAKDKMKTRCVKDPTKYRNVLVLVTDGYIDHVRTRGIGAGNKTANINEAYIDRQLVAKAGFTPTNWPDKYKKGGYGLLPPPNVNLKGLEVLVLEINTYNRKPFWTDLVKQYVQDWFTAMGADRVVVQATDLSVNTEHELGAFLSAQ